MTWRPPRPLRRWAACLLAAPPRRPLATLVLALLAVALSAWWAGRIEPTASLHLLLSDREPAVRAMDRVLSRFAVADELLLVASTRDGEAAPDQLLDFAVRFARALAADPDAAECVTAVRWSAGAGLRRFVEERALPALPLYLDEAGFEAFLERLEPEAMARQMARNEAMLAAGPAVDPAARQVVRDPLRFHELLDAGPFRATGPFRTREAGADLIDPEGRTLLIRLRGGRPAGDLDFTRRLMGGVRRVLESALGGDPADASAGARIEGPGGPGGIDVHLAGAYAVAELGEQRIRSDLIRSVTGTVILLQLLFLLAYRSLWSFPLAIVPVAAGITCGFGLYGLLGAPLTPVTAVIGAILAGLGVDYTIHYLSHRHAVAAPGPARAAGPADPVRVSRRLGVTLAAACATSLLAFGSIGGSTVPALQQFALLGVLGLGGAFVATLTLLPALLRLLDRSAARPGRLRLDPARPLAWLQRHRRLALGCGLLLALLAAGLLAREGPVRVERNLEALHPRPNPPLEAQREIAQRFGAAPEPLLIHLRAGTEGKLIELAGRVEEALRADPQLRAAGLGATLGLGSLLPDPRRVEARLAALEQLDPVRVRASFESAVAASLFDPGAFADYARFLEAVLRPEPALDVAVLRDYTDLAEQLLPRAGPSDGQVTEALTLLFVEAEPEDPPRPGEAGPRRDQLIGAARGALAGLEGATLTGGPVVAHDVERTIRADLWRLLSIAGCLVGVWLLLVFRRPADVARVLVPVTFGLLLLLGLMAAGGIGFNLVNLAALPLLLGLGVDDGIFLVRAARRRGRERAVRLRELAASGHAVTMTSLTTMLAFGSLTFTSTPAIQSLGAVLAIGIGGCYLGSMLLLLPLLLGPAGRPGAGR